MSRFINTIKNAFAELGAGCFSGTAGRAAAIAATAATAALVGSYSTATAGVISGPDADHRALALTYLPGGSAVVNTGGASVAFRTYVDGIQQNLTATALGPRYIVVPLHGVNRALDVNSPTGIAANASIEVSTGPHAQDDRRNVYQVVRMIFFPGAVASNPNAPDYAVGDLGADLMNVAPAVLGSAVSGQVAWAAGFGSWSVPFGTPARDYFARAGGAEILSQNINYNSAYYREGIYWSRTVSYLQWKGLNGDSGSPWFDAGGNLLGMSVAATTGTFVPGRTIFLRFDNPTIRALLLPFTVRTPGCLLADFNADGELNPDDLADYIGAFFAIPPGAGSDFNLDGETNPDDLADYIGAFFAGC